jgi:hypothetical protein
VSNAAARRRLQLIEPIAVVTYLVIFAVSATVWPAW